MNSPSFLLKDILLVDPATSTEKRADVLVVNGRIAEAAKDATTNYPVIDAYKLWLVPGLIDMHSHLRDFAHSDKETIESGTKAAAAGGFTTVLAMANSDPPLDSPALLAVLLKKIEENACIEVLPACCVTREMQGQELTNMVELASLGAAAFSDDGKPIMNLEVLRRALEYSKLTGKIIISHAEDSNLSAGGVMHKSAQAVKLGLPMYSGSAESAAIAREIEVARETRQRLHFAHVSTARSVSLIRAAQAAGVRITGDVTPHHLTLSVDDITEYNSSFKMNPPLRSKEDMIALAQALADGTLCAIATDHAPHTRLEKQACFDCAPLGVLGLETAVPLTLESLVHNKKMPTSKFIALLTTGPAKILGIPEPKLQPGCANFVIIDPQHKWTYKAKEGNSRSSNSPYDGRELTGKVVATVYKSSLVYQDENYKLSGDLAQTGASRARAN
jgi:dihydroorotase